MRFFNVFRRLPRIYLDYASSTSSDITMRSYIPKIPLSILAANPGALHAEGVALKRYLEDARARVAGVLEVHPDEIIFTSGATESDNLAILGVLRAWRADGMAPQEIVVYASDIEHSAVSKTITQETRGGIACRILTTTEGVIDPKDIVVPVGIRAVLISVMYVNNEIGTVQSIQEIAKRVRKLRKLYPEVQFVFHTDATQAPAHLPLRVPALGIDLMTLGATKLYSSKGVGVLYKKRTITLVPILYGGGQEHSLRPGTEPVALAHEFSYALAHAQEIREQESERVRVLQTYFESEIIKQFPQLRITAQAALRSPHISHIAVPNFDSELLVIELDARGIAVSAKSACQNEEGEESPIVEKIYGKRWGAVRFSFGRMTKKKDLNKALQVLHSVFEKYSAIE